MRTDDLIAHLSDGLAPAKAGAVLRPLLIAVAAGLVASTLMMLLGPHLRPDLASAMADFSMWMKLSYTVLIAGFGFWLVERAGRPGAGMARPAALLALPVAAILLLSAIELSAPGADMHHLVMGHSAQVCAFLILLVAAPSLAAAFWGLRQMAPTRLGLSGAGAGLLAGAIGAFVYAFHCDEGSAPFVAVWYTAGIALTAAVGAFLGRWTLRW